MVLYEIYSTKQLHKKARGMMEKILSKNFGF